VSRGRCQRAWTGDGSLALSIDDDGGDCRWRRARARGGARLDESQSGQGIGLAVVRDIVGAYDGQIEIARSDLGGAAVSVIVSGQ
jgi:two-component system sensor histidine kinase PhoQ